MNGLLRIADVMDRQVIRLGKLGSLVLLPLIAVIMFDVVTRRFPALSAAVRDGPLGGYLSSTQLQEMEWHLHGVVLFLALGMAYLRGAHVRIDILRSRTSRSRRAVIEAVGLLVLVLPFLAIVTYYGWFFVERAYLSGEASPSMAGLGHRWIIKFFLVFGIGLTLIAALSVLMRIIVFFRSGEESGDTLEILLSTEDVSDSAG
ncbi:TRAP transporter small permease subunit [Paracoccus versutus]|uniref:TRAP transporter small permease subunit n=1 Tax=Paracoccus versutus TaxID=34007 RepID=UPI001FB76D76|nr:TRAP transporter small permease subunit [Paracoccus versutus]MCJ1901405.1 TRAP transporter small permease subunit [Paracoccus versutus]